ncbi:MAG TPA: hypothetical protein VGM38_08400 [Pseudolysinimonas sp.]
MSTESDRAFTSVSDALLSDPDDDVQLSGASLSVRGTVFARLEGDELLVDLPPSRAADLVSRGIASAADGIADAVGAWVSIHDTENWSELAGEAHQFVGEPPVGRQS